MSDYALQEIAGHVSLMESGVWEKLLPLCSKNIIMDNWQSYIAINLIVQIIFV
jgi:hypothetical protein